MDKDAAAGINTYVWAADSAFFDDIRADGRFQVIHDQGANRAAMGSENKGWLLGDEFDMGSGTCPSDTNAVKNGLPADGRLRFTNYGKGLALPPGTANFNFWADRAEQDCRANAQDVTSVDLYHFTDPYQDPSTPSGYAYGDNMTTCAAPTCLTARANLYGTSSRSPGRGREWIGLRSRADHAERGQVRRVALDHRGRPRCCTSSTRSPVRARRITLCARRGRPATSR